jgi:hypothetical protein
MTSPTDAAVEAGCEVASDELGCWVGEDLLDSAVIQLDKNRDLTS